jgi:hypothetical protein
MQVTHQRRFTVGRLSAVICHWLAPLLTWASCLCVPATVAVAQVDSTLLFFPLNTGDLHQFHYHYTVWCWPNPPISHSSYHMETVVGDTLLPTGFHYKIITSDLPEEPSLRFLRIDTATANVYLYQDFPLPHEVLMDSLRSTLGGSFIREGAYLAQCIEIDTTTFLSTTTIAKRFQAFYIYGEQYSLASGFGRIQRVLFNENPCDPSVDYFYYDLVYARINGNQYGSFVTVAQAPDAEPTDFRLRQNYPNPFNPTTTVEISVPHAIRVDLSVFDILGQHVATLFSGELQSGIHRMLWDATGRSSGVYYYRATQSSGVQTRTMILLK